MSNIATTEHLIGLALILLPLCGWGAFAAYHGQLDFVVFMAKFVLVVGFIVASLICVSIGCDILFDNHDGA